MTDVATDAQRFAPPRAIVSDLPPSGPGQALAGREARLGASMLDGLLVSLIVLPLFFADFGSHVLTDESSPMPSIWRLIAGLVPGYAIALVIQGWFLRTSGQTLGKKALGVRVVRRDGSRAGLVRLLLRGAFANGFALIPLLGSLFALVDNLLIFRDSHQCLHDQVADTIVVTAESSRDATLAAVRATASESA